MEVEEDEAKEHSSIYVTVRVNPHVPGPMETRNKKAGREVCQSITDHNSKRSLSTEMDNAHSLQMSSSQPRHSPTAQIHMELVRGAIEAHCLQRKRQRAVKFRASALVA